jgi:hypothetical protein
MVLKGKEAKGWVSTLKPRSTLVLVDEGMENVQLKDSSKVFVEMTLGKKKKISLYFLMYFYVPSFKH